MCRFGTGVIHHQKGQRALSKCCNIYINRWTQTLLNRLNFESFTLWVNQFFS